jgi:hypothetical protein
LLRLHCVVACSASDVREKSALTGSIRLAASLGRAEWNAGRDR